MACCLSAPSHYLNQCSLITKVQWSSSEGNFVWDITAQGSYEPGHGDHTGPCAMKSHGILSLPWKVIEFDVGLEKCYFAWKSLWKSLKVIEKYQFETAKYFSYLIVMFFLSTILKWVAIKMLSNIFHAFHMCFIHKLVIVKHVYDVAPEKLGKSGCILFIFSMINPAIAT